MGWRVCTLTDISATLSQDELDAYRRSAGFDGSDPVEELLTRTADLVRGYCAAGNVAMSPTVHEIPESLVSPAMDYAAVDILKRLPITVSETRLRAREQALQLFREIASGDYRPEPYGEDPPGSTGQAMPRSADARPERLLD